MAVLLPSFHRLAEGALVNNNGTLDKYLGDGVLITFGTPDASPDEASNALACADELIGTMDHFNDQRRLKAHSVIIMSIGVHFGPFILGDIGTERRLKYAALGETVYVANRFEEMTRNLDCIDPPDEAVKQETQNWERLLEH